ncbi:hypothetical protein LTR84_004381 [Exophiala bonariae]|uniref:Xylanolytic transcriptional activator regulatory domain-containing protein n=1 Tax=Exophiala bonariae TaxID=1690606 RepID=A0AAV9N7Z0_9EURO|nr:hypothetical protein LTR84_004381 [Exophiala bonariae]
MRPVKYLSTCDRCRVWKKRGIQCKFSPIKSRKPYATKPPRLQKAGVHDDDENLMIQADDARSCSIDGVNSVEATNSAHESMPVTQNQGPERASELYVDCLLFSKEHPGSQQPDKRRYAVGEISVSRPISKEQVPSSSLAFFSDEAVERLCQKLGHGKVKDLVTTLEEQMKARWEAAVQQKDVSENLNSSHENESQYIRGGASILKAQAMTAMAVFALNYSSLQIETLCISEAARTIITLCMHKRNLDLESNQEGRRIFWVVYCLEKEYAFNSSHASLISDGDISCPLPTLSDSTLDGFDWLRYWAQYSRILSRAYDSLFSISATLNSNEQYFSHVDHIKQDLQSWKDSIPERLRPGSSLRQHRSRDPHIQELAFRISFAYYNLQICIARLVLHICLDQRSLRRSESKRCLLTAARSIIESSPYIPIDPITPVWILGVMPMVAMFIVFDFVVQNPLHPETKTNMSYLDIVAAHFARLDLASQGTLHDAKVAEFTSIARLHVERCMTESSHTTSRTKTTTRVDSSIGNPDYSEIERLRSMSATLRIPEVTSCPEIPDMAYELDDADFLSAADYNFLDFPDDGTSLYMSLPKSGFDIADFFSHPFV